jgi:hypothetical protein
MYPNYNPNFRNYPSNPMIRTSDDGRSLLLPFLVGAAVAFPIGYIASNTNNKNQYPYYPQQPYNYYPQYTPYYPQQSYNYYPTYY